MLKRQCALAGPLSVAALVATVSVARAEQVSVPSPSQAQPTDEKPVAPTINALPVEPASQKADPVINPRPARGVSIVDRQRPDFDPDGATLGSYTIYPSVRSSVLATNNLYKQPDGRSVIAFVNRFDLRLRPPETPYQFSATGSVQQTTHTRFTTEDTLTYSAHGGFKGMVTPDLTVRANAVRERVALQRNGVGEVINNLKPTRYGRTGFDLSVRNAFQRVVVQAAYAYDDVRFLSNIDPAGNARSERGRNYKRNAFELRGGVLLAPSTEAFALVNHETRRFTLFNTPLRDVDITKAVVGVEGDITPVIHGRVDIGALRTNFKDPTVKDSTDVTFDMELNFFVTDLTTLTVSGDRRLLNVANAATAAALGTSVSARVDHELYRNVILSAEATYSDARYIASTARAKAYTVDVGAEWLLSKRIHLLTGARFEGRTATGFGVNRDFTSVSANVGVQIAL